MKEFDRRMGENLSKPETIESPPVHETQMPLILSFVIDWANLVTLLGLSSGILAIYFALTQNFPAAVIAMLWAVLLDWYDGLVARATPGRPPGPMLFRPSTPRC